MNVSICMTNGGIYQNIKTIDKMPVITLNNPKIKSFLTTANDFIDIEFNSGLGVPKQAVIRTKCISSINFEP